MRIRSQPFTQSINSCSKLTKAFTMNASGLTKGTYYMHIRLKDQLRKERIIE
ncbi:hypothetical protein FAES_3998 [Fibrella aestuarina BUZ 2]|uniref:Uncharacterized protein n=1 Tax=Fibrella aestuarina BUZ 2 TaxID=1166018 RepID=I0KCZ6_9BACT|nr:hypothetical protein FAES_3998 [Fibrella aestuarina BUZ 2]